MRTIKYAMMIAIAGIAATPALSLADAPITSQSVSLTQEPVIMRLSKDEFRIAFGLSAGACATNVHGCSGVIRYRVAWKTDDGTVRSETKRVSFSVAPQSSGALTVDRQYFDTAEGAHHTDVVKVTVASITCADGIGSTVTRTASLASN